MSQQPIDRFATTLPADKRASVYQSTKSTHEKRTKLLFDQFPDPNRLREIAGEINDLVRESLRFYPHIAASDVTVTLVHSGEQILPEVSPNLRAFARREMERAGITVLTSVRAAAATRDGIWLKDGRQLTGRTIVCTIGTAPERIAAITASKSAMVALRLPISVISRLWNSGSLKRMSAATIETST